MVKPGDVMELPRLGVRVELRHTSVDTDGELVEFDVVGRPRGLIVLPHVHPGATEHHEVIDGPLLVRRSGYTHVLRSGRSATMQPGTIHRQGFGTQHPTRVRYQVTPAVDFDGWLERIADLGDAGRIDRFGFPSASACAELTRDFPLAVRLPFPPAAIQRLVQRMILCSDDRAAA
jgi:quercetin dioxygenase-like cupin family protein